MKKEQIRDAALSGLPLQGYDVAAKMRGGGALKLRHAWRDDEDSRVWDGVRRAFTRLAQLVADTTGGPVKVYTKQGRVVTKVFPGENRR